MRYIPSDGIARKYCFRASVKIVNKAKVPIGIFFGYDTKPTIAKDVETVGQQYCLEKDEALGYTCDEVELVLHAECPVEITSDISFQSFESLENPSK